jgi:hypothetical protein
MGEHIAEQNINRRSVRRKPPRKQTTEVIGRKLLDVVVYRKHCCIGNKLTLRDLAETSEVIHAAEGEPPPVVPRGFTWRRIMPEEC